MAIALAIYGAVLMATNPWFTAVDDEVVITDVAAKPFLKTIQVFLGGTGQHEHPPLSDLVLHGWLWLTAGNLRWLRLPSVIFYLLGAWFLVQAARRIAGDRAGYSTLALLLLWPYGFHFARIAGWYSFTFMLVSVLTFFYLRYVEDPTLKRWLPIAFCALALVYTNYFAWAVLGCIGLDLISRFWRDKTKWIVFLSTAVLLVLANVPILAAFLREVRRGAHPAPLSASSAATGIYNLYCLFVSESVAPWFWVLGVAAGLAIACALLCTLIYTVSDARRFFIYFFLLLGAMTFVQIGNTKRSLMISPWLLLPVGVAVASATLPSARRALAAALLLIGAIGWYGIFARSLYAAPHWIEPWQKVARQAAQTAGTNGVIIANNPGFFFYLTYLLPATNPVEQGHFSGYLPVTVRTPGVYFPQQWIDAGRPMARTVMLVNGLSFEVPGATIEDLGPVLDAHCKKIDEQRLVHDSGAKWKREFQPVTGQRVWRIQVTTYTCPAP
ncbi:MAG TPA: glycosyltransferase family 39 protein [Candidatus Acidoferrales bacterium]